MRLFSRTLPGNTIYHVLNRANARVPIFQSESDYQLFLKTLIEAWEQSGMRILAFVIMPNHWHLVLYPQEEGELSQFMSWLTNTHVKRWQSAHNLVGTGHLYQNSYKVFPVETDTYCLNVIRYIESNPFRAKMVDRAEKWRWSSLWIREKGSSKQKKMLADWPIIIPENYLSFVNEQIPKELTDSIHDSLKKGNPFGEDIWMKITAEKMGIVIKQKRKPKIIP
ncbi:MAG: transposase [Patescibacteria group bacterium]